MADADCPPLQCRRCFHKGEPDLGWRVFSNNTLHLEGLCRSCGTHIQFLKQTDGEYVSVWTQHAPALTDEQAAIWNRQWPQLPWDLQWPF